MLQDCLLLTRASNEYVKEALNSPDHSNFTDVTLVFADGRVDTYRSLLWLLAPWWREALDWSSSLVLLPDTTCDQFMESLAAGKQILQNTDTVKGHIKKNIKLSSEVIPKPKSVKMEHSLEDKPEPLVEGEDEAKNNVKLAPVPSKLMSSVLSSFPWPSGLPAPSHHR